MTEPQTPDRDVDINEIRADAGPIFIKRYINISIYIYISTPPSSYISLYAPMFSIMLSYICQRFLIFSYLFLDLPMEALHGGPPYARCMHGQAKKHVCRG